MPSSSSYPRCASNRSLPYVQSPSCCVSSEVGHLRQSLIRELCEKTAWGRGLLVVRDGQQGRVNKKHGCWGVVVWLIWWTNVVVIHQVMTFHQKKKNKSLLQQESNVITIYPCRTSVWSHHLGEHIIWPNAPNKRQRFTGWWFQLIWKKLVKMGIFPK